MIVVNRFRQGSRADEDLAAALQQALGVLGLQRGYVDGVVGRNVDDPDLWLLTTRWEGPGAYRRALSAYDVKITAWETLGTSLDEPSAYEVLGGSAPLNQARPRKTE